MKHFEFNLFMVTEQDKSIKVGEITIKATTLQEAQRTFNSMDVPHHTKAIVVQY